ncbi:MAG: hypothetical protein PHN89_00575 [Candidatus Pacebacteria bacterium]|nr:hypothetical protein [Candidatus Paceibacterota bacterium]
MAKEIEITCSACGKKVKTTGAGDFSTFVCEDCNEVRNLKAYKAELSELEGGAKEGITQSQAGRAKFLKSKIVFAEKIVAARRKK